MIRKLLGALTLVMIWNMSAAAGSDFDFTGNLTYHNDIHYYKIVMQKGADTQLFTTSWLGATLTPCWQSGLLTVSCWSLWMMHCIRAR
ncbi:hypothetical protein [Oleidesulfovibrio sp.]|uniref:hypothetical protein n=1 Tax=Oleidesulfovibrio sp. TaxID=2909707 RepID=UPI003A84C06D